MRTYSWQYLPLFVFALAGCSTHPLVDDRTGLSTADIIHKVRCEMRDAFLPYAEAYGYAAKKAAYAVAETEFSKHKSKAAKDLSRLLNDLLDGKISRQDYHIERWKVFKDLTKHENRRIEIENRHLVFAKQTIAYDFRFQITETNNFDGGATFVWPIHFGTAKVSVGGKDNRTRFSDRAVKLAETVGHLVELKHCDEAIFERSRRYPIKGIIGLDETVGEYIRVRGTKALDLTSASYQDTVRFTTDISADADASVTLNPSRGRTISANIGGDAGRKDIHEVLVKIAPYTEQRPKDPPDFELAQVIDVRIIEGNITTTEARPSASGEGQPRTEAPAAGPPAAPDMAPKARRARPKARRDTPSRELIEQAFPTRSEKELDRVILERALRELNEQQRLDADRELRDFLQDR